MRKRASVLLSVAAIAVVASGCSSAPGDSRAAYEPAGPVNAPGTPMAELPAAAGGVVSVIQSEDRGVITQKVVLRGDAATWGENGAVVVVDESRRNPGDPSGAAPKPTEAMIARELRETFPDLDMEIGLTWSRNNFGPFGYAVGRKPIGVTCLYAWQYAPGHAPRLLLDVSADAADASTPQWPTSVRVRLCKQNVEASALVDMVSEMAVYPPQSTTPYFDPTFKSAEPGARDALEATGLPGAFYLGPAKSASLGGDAEVARRGGQRTHFVHNRRHRRVDDAALPPAAAPDGVTVPVAGEGSPAEAGPPASTNPLLAPLKDTLGEKPKPAASAASAAPSDIPLPTPQAGSAASSGAGSAASVPAPIPLPQ